MTTVLTPLQYAKEHLRRERDRLLAETDWVVTRAIEQNIPVDPEVAAYRQALRDLPSKTQIHLNRFDLLDWERITLPVKPKGVK